MVRMDRTPGVFDTNGLLDPKPSIIMNLRDSAGRDGDVRS
jgi:hypothetical protein